MAFQMADLTARESYKLLTACIVPRPIALVTTLDGNGVLNAAPFSYFNLMGHNPPVVVFAPGNRTADLPKDTPGNIAQHPEFVVNLVDEAIAERMNICAVDFPPGVNELEQAGLTTAPSVAIAVPRIAESPVSLECREVETLEIGQNRIVLGEVVVAHFRDGLVSPDNLHVDTPGMHLVGRMHGRSWYTRTNELFQMKRMSHQQWLDEQ
jgi:flavin reductase (DIM6/NTAB) family NADH-FMN oxidoreductase RutF